MNCNYPNCKNHKSCNLKEPPNQEHQLLNNEINYWLNELNQAKRRIKEYSKVLNEIKNHRYSYTINVYGNIQYAPKQNCLGVTIRRPEHIYYGWNLNKLEKNVEEILETIKELRVKEFELRKMIE